MVDVVDKIRRGVESFATRRTTGSGDVALVHSDRKRIQTVTGDFALNRFEEIGFTQSCPRSWRKREGQDTTESSVEQGPQRC